MVALHLAWLSRLNTLRFVSGAIYSNIYIQLDAVEVAVADGELPRRVLMREIWRMSRLMLSFVSIRFHIGQADSGF